MRSIAYREFLERSSESRLLLRRAVASRSYLEASAYAKAAVVLTAASLERFVNDRLDEHCRGLALDKWDDLSEGHRKFFMFQFASRLAIPSYMLWKQKGDLPKLSARLQKGIRETSSALSSPKTWTAFRAYGMFLSGAAEPERIDKTLRLFHPTGRGFLEFLAVRGVDKGSMITAITGLIDARHAAAHAKATAPPGPADAMVWARLSYVLVRHIEAYLLECR